MKARRLRFSVILAVSATSFGTADVFAQPIANEQQVANNQAMSPELQLLLKKSDEERQAAFVGWGYPEADPRRVGGGGTVFTWQIDTRDDASKVWSYYLDKLSPLPGEPAVPNSQKVPWASAEVRNYLRQDNAAYTYVRIQPKTLGTILVQNNEGTLIITVTERRAINGTTIEMYKFLSQEALPVGAPLDNEPPVK